LRTFNIIAYDLDKKNNHVQYKSLWGNEKDEAVRKASKQFKDNYHRELNNEIIFLDRIRNPEDIKTSDELLETIGNILSRRGRIDISPNEFREIIKSGGTLVYDGKVAELNTILHSLCVKISPILKY
jgi:hypothetical protein